MGQRSPVRRRKRSSLEKREDTSLAKTGEVKPFERQRKEVARSGVGRWWEGKVSSSREEGNLRQNSAQRGEGGAGGEDGRNNARNYGTVGSN